MPRQIDPKSKFGERALLSVALNYYHVQDYAKMKVILREYLKVFDNVDNEQRQLAAYWIGWVFEKENNLRDASNYYARAAEERLIVYKLPADKKPLTREELKKSLSYESQAALLETCAGEFVEKPLSELLEFVTLNSHLELRTDASAQSVNANVNRPAFKNVPIFDVLCDALDSSGCRSASRTSMPSSPRKLISGHSRPACDSRRVGPRPARRASTRARQPRRQSSGVS